MFRAHINFIRNNLLHVAGVCLWKSFLYGLTNVFRRQAVRQITTVFLPTGANEEKEEEQKTKLRITGETRFFFLSNAFVLSRRNNLSCPFLIYG